MSTEINISKKITAKDETVVLTSDVNSINFTGTGITATTVGNDVTVTVPGSAAEYNVYTALLTQTGVTAPVATVLENTIGNIVWSYYGVGQYQGILNGAFLTDKTFIIIGGPYVGGNNGYCFAGYYNSNEVTVYSAGGPNKVLDAGDDILEVTSIEIRVYP